MTIASTLSTAKSEQKRRSWSGSSPINALFVVPFLVLYLGLLIYPLVSGAWMSLFDYDLISGTADYVGAKNYQRLFDDRIFLGAVRNTVTFVAMMTPIFVVVGLALALALNQRTRVHAALRTTFFATSVLSVTIVTLIWRVVLMPNRGLISNIMTSMGFDPIPFVNSPVFAMPALGVTTVWWCIGLPMMLFLAALQQIPQDLYEAAALDNAGRWRSFVSITLPSIKRTVILVAVIEIIMQFQIFGQPYLMTRGGPNNATRSMVQFIYESAFSNWRMGYAAAAAQILFVIMLAAAAVQMWVGSRGAEGRK